VVCGKVRARRQISGDAGTTGLFALRRHGQFETKHAADSSIAMIVFVIEINGRSILAFNADSQIEAEQHAMSPQIRSDLMVYETVDGPIWNGQDEIVVREALPDERARWLFMFANSEPPDTPMEGRFTLHIFIVEIVNEADGDARQKPLN
jgi:hypothetical protein